jgi:endogenous inhibitor of DNA gyrase (YacG/DUF329 family)
VTSDKEKRERFLKYLDIDVPCPNCGEDLFVNLAALRKSPECRCPACGKVCSIDPDAILDSFRPKTE